MRIALIVNSFPTLSETFIFNKAIGLQEAGLDVTVWVHSRRNDAHAFTDYKRNFPQKNIQKTYLVNGWGSAFWEIAKALFHQPMAAWHLWRQAWGLYPQLRRALRAWLFALPLQCGHFDLIHFEFSGLAILYLDALPLLQPAKLLTSCRGAAEQIMPLLEPERIHQLRQVFSQMDAVHCVSADIQRTAEHYGLRPEQAFINHPAIDPQRFQRKRPYLAKTQGPWNILSVGRLHWKKGLEFGVLAIHQLVKSGFDVHYAVIGGGDEEEKLHYLIATLGLEGHVKLLGRQPSAKVYQILEETDIFLLPSLSEGLSNAVIEAMSMEVPVVSTLVGGMGEAITDGKDGFLVPSLQADSLADKVKYLLENPILRVQIGIAGRRRILQSFYISHQLDIFLETYKYLLSDQANIKIPS